MNKEEFENYLVSQGWEKGIISDWEYLQNYAEYISDSIYLNVEETIEIIYIYNDEERAEFDSYESFITFYENRF